MFLKSFLNATLAYIVMHDGKQLLYFM